MKVINNSVKNGGSRHALSYFGEGLVGDENKGRHVVAREKSDLPYFVRIQQLGKSMACPCF